jgi:hypothetical protein
MFRLEVLRDRKTPRDNASRNKGKKKKKKNFKRRKQIDSSKGNMQFKYQKNSGMRSAHSW